MGSNSFEPDTVSVAAHVRSKPGSKAKPSASFEADTPSSAGGGAASFAPVSGYQKAVNTIPYITGGAGSILGSGAGAVIGAVGGPTGAAVGRKLGSVAGADVFGAGGEAVRQLLTEVPALVSGGVPAYDAAGGPASPREAFQRMAEVGSQQAELDAGGQILGGVSKGLGKLTMMAALRANPALAQTAIDYGIKFTEAGKKKAFELIGGISKYLQRIASLAGAKTKGGGLDATYIANRIQNEVQSELNKSSTLPADQSVINKLTEMRRQFISSNPRTIALNQAHQFASTARQEANQSFVRLANGEKMQLPDDPVRKQWKLVESRVLRDELGNATGGVRVAGKTYNEWMDLQSKLIAVKNIIAPETADQAGTTAEKVVRHGIPLATMTGGAVAGEELGRRHVTPGGPLAGAAGGALLGSPAGLSVLALLLSHPALLNTLRAGPQVGAGLAAAH